MKPQFFYFFIFLFLYFLFAPAGHLCAATVETRGQFVTIRPDGGEARIVRLQVVADRIIRVQATSHHQLTQKQPSLIVIPQTATPPFTVHDSVHKVVVKATDVQAIVHKQTGQVQFCDAHGKTLLAEANPGKHFWTYNVPQREIGRKGGKQPTDEMKQGLQWQIIFDSPPDEAFYGLGQHQSQQLNMKGKNEDLFQYNTKVAIPFLLSTKGYGLLWDSYSYCRFGKADEYLQLNRAFRLFDRHRHVKSGKVTPRRSITKQN